MPRARWQEFISRCMQQKRLKGQSRERIQEELRSCVDAGRAVLGELVPRDIDEVALAKSILGQGR